MFDWLRRKKPKAALPALPAKAHGLFNTDLPDVRPSRHAVAEFVNRLSFQRDITSFAPRDSEGKAVSGVAMDEAAIQTVSAIRGGGFGYGIPDAQLMWFGSQSFIGYQTCALLMQNWFIDKACTMPGRDAVRHGYEVTVNDGTDVDPKVFDYIRKRDKEMRIKSQCQEFSRFGRCFGIRIAMFDILSTDPKYYEKPFNPDGITPNSYRGITQIDPYWISPELDQQATGNPANRHFYEPTWWRINGKRVHRSHLVITRNGDELPDILKPTYLWGGVPFPQKLAERIYAAERTANEAPLLSAAKRMTVLHTNLEAAVANQDQFATRMEWWTQQQNNFGVKIVGEKDVIEQFDTALTDLDAVIMTQFQLACAIAEVPATKMLGTTPKGFNATGEYESRSYSQLLETIQENDLSPLIERHHLCLMRSEVMHVFNLPKPLELTLNWNPSDSPTAIEIATINKTKADTDSALTTAGAIDGYDSRQRLITDPNSGYTGIPDVVPDGPGDRAAIAEEKAAALEAQNEPDAGAA